MSDVTDFRLGRIEGEITRIADAITALARVEERQVAQDAKLSDHETRIRLVEERSASAKQGIAMWERVGWMIVAAIVAGLAKFLPIGLPAQAPIVQRPAIVSAIH